MFVGSTSQARPFDGIALEEVAGVDHFGEGGRAAEGGAEAAVGEVAAAGEGGEYHGGGGEEGGVEGEGVGMVVAC